MKTMMKLTLPALAIACVVAPLAFGSPPTNSGTQNAATKKPGSTEPGPNASPAAKGKAYGRYCQGQSKTHVAGQKGTPFSQCVTAMAKLANGNTTSPTTACSTMSKKHVAGQKGTPFSRCVSAGAKLLKDHESDEQSAAGAP
jgi:hypothetical protein